MPDELSAPEEKQRRGPRSNQKLKILYLAKILLEYTDAKNDITLQDIIDKLAAYNVTAERKSLYDDIAQLNDFGIKIKKTQYGRTSHYQVINRDFELAELKLLVDSVASAKFITEQKSNELIQKIERLASKPQASMLQRQVYVAGRVKAMNNDIMENVDAIHNAISQNLQISFWYIQWNVQKEPELRRNGERYVISPWGLSFRCKLFQYLFQLTTRKLCKAIPHRIHSIQKHGESANHCENSKYVHNLLPFVLHSLYHFFTFE